MTLNDTVEVEVQSENVECSAEICDIDVALFALSGLSHFMNGDEQDPIVKIHCSQDGVQYAQEEFPYQAAGIIFKTE